MGRKGARRGAGSRQNGLIANRAIDRLSYWTMEIERDNVEKPLRRLRKALKRFPTDPSSGEVHSLRTNARQLEAIVDALMLDSRKKTRQLLKSVSPVRKAAGDVRDMDVLVGNVLALSRDHEDDSLVRLVEHLGERRVESARGLSHTVASKRKAARRSLKQYAQLVGKEFHGKRRIVSPAEPVAAEIVTELTGWPELNEENIHPFRIKVKRLRYMLQLSKDADGKIVEDLGQVKDLVGDWHDWQELAKIAKGVLDPQEDRSALRKIEEIGNRKFKDALTKANAARKRYFSNGWHGDGRGPKAKPAALK
jgi:CHAD domain-containing protein